MTKEEFIKLINEIVDYIDNGKVESKGREFNGHPHFYLLHNKDEFNEELNRVIKQKEKYTRYDLYYVLKHMFKYVLNEYDSHTTVFFNNPSYLPIKVKMVNDKLYIIDGLGEYKKYIGTEIKNINGISINKILEELDYITCYASKDYFYTQVELNIVNIEKLKSLPSIGDVDTLIFSDDYTNIDFKIDEIKNYSFEKIDNNYKVDIIDDTLILSYLACENEEKMKETVEYIKTLDGINHYIVDIRGNSGGNSSINNYLTDFLKDKDTICLTDERVFSSARMCLAKLKRNGALIIGKTPGTPLSCFGNSRLKKEIDELGLSVRGSVNYWYYDSNLKCHGYKKEDFDEAINNNPHILDTVFFNVDIELEPSLEDILNNNDTVLEFAIDYINNKKEYKHI